MKTKFYLYDQNNSWGRFDEDENLCQNIYIEAKNEDDANNKAVEIGIYFNGVKDGIDCPCCGDRWYRANESYSKESVIERIKNSYRWTTPKARIFYINGEIKEFD